VRPRFYLPNLDREAARGRLDEHEARHLSRVLRLGPGADIEVLDGVGGLFHARVTTVWRDGVDVALIAPVTPAAEPRVQVGLVMSVLKGDSMDAVVRDAAMMGVATVQPVISARSETTIAALQRGHRARRWSRVAVSSVKQCGRATVPRIFPPVTLEAWLGSRATARRLALVEPSSARGHSFSAIDRSPVVDLLVGPEGGWTPAELARLDRADVPLVTLGPRTLRAEAAPTIALAALFEAWNAW
jgi:16S rRNA (uracil1498-N3)-methyltransferase